MWQNGYWKDRKNLTKSAISIIIKPSYEGKHMETYGRKVKHLMAEKANDRLTAVYYEE